MHEYHQLDPVFNDRSKILILGSFPSIASRDAGFYYAHKSNRFWPLMRVLFSAELLSIEEKKEFLLSHGIALWDVIAECDITKSSDASIKNLKPNDLNLILGKANIKRIYLNGAKAYELYQKHWDGKIKVEGIKLPSTSSANASFSFERLLLSWGAVKNDLALPS